MLRLVTAAICLLALPALAPGGVHAAPNATLNLGAGSLPEGGSLDPNRTNYVDTFNLQRTMLLPLYDASATGLTPVLAAGAPVVGNGGRTITIHLRVAKWSDGKPVVAADVVTALARSRARGGTFFAGFAAHVRRAVAVNPRTVRLELVGPDPTVVPLLSTNIFTPVPTSVIKRYGNRWTAPGRMVANGPFRLTARSSTSITLARNIRYFGVAHVKLAKIVVWTRLSTPVLLQRMRGGTIDAALQNVVPLGANVDGTDVTIDRAPTQGAQYMYMNTRNPLLADARVRRGIALAVDRAAISALRGGDPALSSFAPQTMPGGPAAAAGPRLLASSGTPDVAAAQAQLAAAGWSPTNRSLNLVYSSDSDTAPKIAEVVQRSLADVGVSVTLKPMYGDAFSAVGVGISPTKPGIDLVLQGWIVDYPDLWDFYQLMTCANINAGLNSSNYCSASYDAIGRSISSTYSRTARLAAFRRLEDALTGRQGAFPVVPLYQQDDRVARQTWVQGFMPSDGGLFSWDRIAIRPH